MELRDIRPWGRLGGNGTVLRVRARVSIAVHAEVAAIYLVADTVEGR